MSERSQRAELESLQASLRVKEGELARQETAGFALRRQQVLEAAERLERELHGAQTALAPWSSEVAQLTATVSALRERHQRAEHQKLSPLLLVVLLPAVAVASLSGAIWLVEQAQADPSRWVEFALVSFLSPLLFVNLWVRLLLRGAKSTSVQAVTTLVASLAALGVYSLAATHRLQPERPLEWAALALSVASAALGAAERARRQVPSEVLKVARFTAFLTGLVAAASLSQPGSRGVLALVFALVAASGALRGAEWLSQRRLRPGRAR
jgi:hypothetical protein